MGVDELTKATVLDSSQVRIASCEVVGEREWQVKTKIVVVTLKRAAKRH